MTSKPELLVVKAFFSENPEEIRRIALRYDSAASLASFKTALAEALTLNPDTFKLKYKDVDGDLVSLYHDRDMLEALRQVADSPAPLLRVQIITPTKAAKAAPRPEEARQPSAPAREASGAAHPFAKLCGSPAAFQQQLRGLMTQMPQLVQVAAHLMPGLVPSAAPAKPSGLSVRELKAALAARGIDCSRVVEKRQLIALLEKAKAAKSCPAPASTSTGTHCGGRAAPTSFGEALQAKMAHMHARRQAMEKSRADRQEAELQAAIQASLADEKARKEAEESKEAAAIGHGAPASASSGAAAPSESQEPPVERPKVEKPKVEKPKVEEPKRSGHPFVKKLELLHAAGWTDRDANIEALVESGGDVPSAIRTLLASTR